MFGPALLVCPVTNPVKYLTKKKVDFIPAKNLMSRDGKQGCLDIDYFAGKDSSNPVFECKIVELAVTWSGQLPQQLVDKPYSVQMNGSLAIDDSSGAYTFSATTSGGAQVWIDGRQIINAPDNASLTNFSANYVFTRTGKHQIKILHFQPKPGECSFKFEWANSNAVEKLSSTLTSYLPENKNGWFDFWTNEKLLGGQLHTREVPLSIMPIYVKAGSILPFGPVVQSTGDNAGDTLDVRIYPGNDARFTLYEDEGDSYRYEKGLRSEIAFRWIDSKKEIVIGKRDGEFPGMKKDRYFRILMVEDGNTLAAGPSMRVCKIVRYSGKPVSVDCSAK
jgi:alpha-D-xyloside xylohydrolase